MGKSDTKKDDPNQINCYFYETPHINAFGRNEQLYNILLDLLIQN